jgi:Na+/H+ antiporter NhaD/arsenite permease-like protein
LPGYHGPRDGVNCRASSKVAHTAGARVGGNGTLIGAAGKFAVAGIARRNGVRFDLGASTKYVAALSAVSRAICPLFPARYC